MRKSASAAPSACRRARSMRSSAHTTRCTPSSSRCARAASCAWRPARSTASVWCRGALSRTHPSLPRRTATASASARITHASRRGSASGRRSSQNANGPPTESDGTGRTACYHGRSASVRFPGSLMTTLRIAGTLVLAQAASLALNAGAALGAKLPQTMKAAAIDRTGGPEVITLHTLPVPKPAADEVLIAVDTAGVAIWDAHLRAHPEGIKHSAFPLVLGTDGAGTVAAVGEKVKRFKVGDVVYSYSWDNPHGGFYAVLAFAGGDSLERCVEALRAGGRIAYPYGVKPDPRPRDDTAAVIRYNAVPGPQEFERLNRAIEAAKLRVPIEAEFPLAQADKAQERVEAGHILGKIVLRIR